MKLLAFLAWKIMNSLRKACEVFTSVWRRDFKSLQKDASNFEDICKEFFHPFTDQASINDFLDI